MNSRSLGRRVRLAWCLCITLLAALSLSSVPAGAASSSPLIVGGTQVPNFDDRWPYIAQVYVTDADEEYLYFACGGTMIARNWILTAAHCDDPDFPIVAAEGGQKGVFGGYPKGVAEVIPHPDYNPDTGENDLLLLRLEDEPYLPTAAFPKIAATADDPATGASVKVAGWGDTVEGSGEGAEWLREAEVEIVSNSSCSATYDALDPSLPIFSSQICAAHFDGIDSRDTCQGDSGGPMISDTGSGPVLVGIVQGGEGCAQSPYPGIYTRVSSYRDWITQQLQPSLSFSYSGFWETAVGEEATTGAKIINNGKTSAKVSAPTVTGEGFSVLNGSNCADRVVKPGESCDFGITFRALRVGANTGTVSFTSDVPGIGPHSFSVVGNANAPAPQTLSLKKKGSLRSGRVVRVNKKNRTAVLQVTVLSTFPERLKDLNLRCSGRTIIPAPSSLTAKIFGEKRARVATASSMVYGPDPVCLTNFSVRIPLSALGKRVKVTVLKPANPHAVAATLTKTIRVEKKLTRK